MSAKRVLVRIGMASAVMLALISCAGGPQPTDGPGQATQAGESDREPFTKEEIKAYNEFSKGMTPYERGQYLTLPTRKAREEFLRKRGIMK